MNEQNFREGINLISEILKVFVLAKQDEGKTFLKIVNNEDKNYIEGLLNEYKKKGNSDKKVNGIRVKVLEGIQNGGISFEDVAEQLNKAKKEEGFGNWGTFGILYTLYYSKYRDDVVNFFDDLMDNIKKDIKGDDLYVRYSHFDGGQNYGKDEISISSYNNCWVPIYEMDKDNKKEILTKIKQFRLTTIGDSIFRIGLYTNNNFVDGNYTDYQISSFNYQDLINEFNKYQDILKNDKLPDIIQFIKDNAELHKDIKEKAEQERNEFNKKYPLERLMELPLEDYNYGSGNLNHGSFTGALNTEYAISGFLFSNGQNWLFYKDGDKFNIATNMNSYLKEGNGDIKKAFEIYIKDIYNFIKNFDIRTYNQDDFLPGANYLKASLILMYKGIIFIPLGSPTACYTVAAALNILPTGNKKIRTVDIINYGRLITDCLKERIPEVIDKYGYAVIGRCLSDYYDKYYSKQTRKSKTKSDDNQQLQQQTTLSTQPSSKMTKTLVPLNTILFGVPGTGKTYNSINYAVAAIEGKSLEEITLENWFDVKKKYEEYKEKGQIVFTTFHQSFGYEDFIEGIKAEIDDNDTIKYEVKPGVFKDLCEKARINLEDSKKNIAELSKEKSITDHLMDFLYEATSEKKEFKLITKNKFYVQRYNNEHVYITNPSNEKADSIRLRVSELIVLLNSGKELTKAKEITNFFNYQYARQEDSYYCVLYNECKKKLNNDKEEVLATGVDKKNYVIIIDEINRGNISKIFGELITLIEPKKRLGENEAMTVKLPYSNNDIPFGVPNNLYIIGTMNTSDRSIALMDLALRRRFKFREIEPDSTLLENIKVGTIDIKKLFESYNDKIEFLYDRDHLLGHSYFLDLKEDNSIEKLNEIMLDNIIPLLQEYFHDDWEKIQLVLGDRIIEKKMVPAKEVGIDSNDYDEQPKYKINTHLSESDYLY